jgi:protein phosphatase 2C family protein 2/3
MPGAQGFLECDRVMRTEESLKDEMAGSTAVVVLTQGTQLWCSNAGDSRCVAGVAGAARPLSFDHKPLDTKERARIEAAGGFVEFNRVNGNLALSRAMGDFVFKMNDKLGQADQVVCQPAGHPTPDRDLRPGHRARCGGGGLGLLVDSV